MSRRIPVWVAGFLAKEVTHHSGSREIQEAHCQILGSPVCCESEVSQNCKSEDSWRKEALKAARFPITELRCKFCQSWGWLPGTVAGAFSVSWSYHRTMNHICCPEPIERGLQTQILCWNNNSMYPVVTILFWKPGHSQMHWYGFMCLIKFSC